MNATSRNDKWNGSHHQLAMAEASDETVLGDFADAEFRQFGVTSRFYKKDGRFMVATRGPGGEMGDFEITHTFGWFPLQQYLIPFPDGRLQCLPIAWDSRENRWYHLYPDRQLAADDWLYWTNNGQNWNAMCAECHSTDLRKNYDPKTDSYRTAWSEISVGCEACHGPGSDHVAWAQLPEMGRPDVANTALAVDTGEMTSAGQLQLCAPCHARRMSLDDNIHAHADFLDYGIPQLLSEGMYFPDGQILDEVYVYGSFVQSKMHARDVRCSDCHDVHSIKRIKDGNALCLQCHRAAIYDTRDHHFHKKRVNPATPSVTNPEKSFLTWAPVPVARAVTCPGGITWGSITGPTTAFAFPGRISALSWTPPMPAAAAMWIKPPSGLLTPWPNGTAGKSAPTTAPFWPPGDGRTRMRYPNWSVCPRIGSTRTSSVQPPWICGQNIKPP
jgi:hypothetical protein